MTDFTVHRCAGPPLRYETAKEPHQTLIDDQMTEAGKSMLKIRMVMKHIGKWRTIPATGAEVSAVGYQFFRLADGKIIEHWALIDDNALENNLKQIAASGCKIAN